VDVKKAHTIIATNHVLEKHLRRNFQRQHRLNHHLYIRFCPVRIHGYILANVGLKNIS
jgi:hypothetical protein